MIAAHVRMVSLSFGTFHVFAAYELLKKPREPTKLEPWDVLITLVEWRSKDLTDVEEVHVSG
jgi:hypothetical protein